MKAVKGTAETETPHCGSRVYVLDHYAMLPFKNLEYCLLSPKSAISNNFSQLNLSHAQYLHVCIALSSICEEVSHIPCAIGYNSPIRKQNHCQSPCFTKEKHKARKSKSFAWATQRQEWELETKSACSLSTALYYMNVTNSTISVVLSSHMSSF